MPGNRDGLSLYFLVVCVDFGCVGICCEIAQMVKRQTVEWEVPVPIPAGMIFSTNNLQGKRKTMPGKTLYLEL